MKAAHILRFALLGVVGLILMGLAVACLVYPPVYVFRVLIWQESDAFDWQKFPSHPLTAAPTAYHFQTAPEARVESLLQEVSGQSDWDEYMQVNQTQAFIVLHGDQVLFERYYNDARRDSMVTSFSVAKSFVSSLIGIAIQEGYIGSVSDPVTLYLPELAQRDPRFAVITIRDLLRMSSGLEYVEMRPLLLNGDDPLTTYYPDQRRISLQNTHIIEAPGKTFSYNKYHPQLLAMILERTTRMPMTTYLQTRLWDPLGMEYDGSWSTDSVASDFERSEAGLNARAMDFAKFGALFLHDGQWNGRQIINEAWVRESTSPWQPDDYNRYYNAFVKGMPGRGYYSYFWWGIQRDDGSYDFAAEGDKGQFIYVSPAKDLVLVRNGINYGIDSHAWFKLCYDFATAY